MPQCVAYLHDNLHFYLGEQEREGLKRFYELAVAIGLAPAGRSFPVAHGERIGQQF